jgi:malate synthase
MLGYTNKFGLWVAKEMEATVASIIASNAPQMPPDTFWSSFAKIVADMAPRNAALLRKRDALQALIDAYLLERKGDTWDPDAYKAFLCEIGYIVPAGPPFKASTRGIDEEIKVAGPQLVVPVDNARYALNAANARWTSLLDAFYGTTAGPPQTKGLERGQSYNPARGEVVFQYAHAFLDEAFPLKSAKYDDVVEYSLVGPTLSCKLVNGSITGLKHAAQFVGYTQTANNSLSSVLIQNNGLHVDIIIARKGPGLTHPAGVSDIVMESALTSIMDCEDSVAAVDAEDKAIVYR